MVDVRHNTLVLILYMVCMSHPGLPYLALDTQSGAVEAAAVTSLIHRWNEGCPMRNLTAVFCLAVALLMGSVGTSWSGDYQKGWTAYQRGDYATAIREWTPLAKQGDAVTQFSLGLAYVAGDDVKKGYKAAVRWWKLAAKQGLSMAQYRLALAYVQGLGVPKDDVLAYAWLNIAAGNGDEVASVTRDSLAKQMTSDDVAKAQQLARECVRKSYKGC